ncbi:hypothetical protein [Pseudoroseicyclus aestuarii]|uniref:Uncharacterized protein n=1 Tax=Pseudoroseicyclus aestuarii TaxID=1795041 RepID=A0A318SVH2_9RHOB|nr:hypothetical protein [Pseudoroseicyclus aestuarii]PYE84359.1 hypothetical protein DFP88_102157 [Pseudoroseicyclus aestuarii]
MRALAAAGLIAGLAGGPALAGPQAAGAAAPGPRPSPVTPPEAAHPLPEAILVQMRARLLALDEGAVPEPTEAPALPQAPAR